MTGMANPGGSFDPHNEGREKKEELPRATPELVVRFNGLEFLPSDETPLGAALRGNLSKRSDQGQYSVSFKRPYLVDLCVGSGAALTEAPLSIKGFVLGASPSGTPSVLGLISADGKKVRLPVVLVHEQHGEWQLVDTPLGWNRALQRSNSKDRNNTRSVNFGASGVFLVVRRDTSEGAVPLPLTVHSVVVTDGGNVIKARTRDGRVFEPRSKQADLDSSLLPPLSSAPDEEYALAPLELAPELKVPVPPEFPLPSKEEFSRVVHASQRTLLEARDFRMELALRRLCVRERALLGKEKAEILSKILKSSAEKEATNETALSDMCKHLVLMAGGNTRANLIADLCRKWIDHHHNRVLWKEVLWKEYYEDLFTVAPLLSSLESDLNRCDASEYDKKLAERRKR